MTIVYIEGSQKCDMLRLGYFLLGAKTIGDCLNDYIKDLNVEVKRGLDVLIEVKEQ